MTAEGLSYARCQKWERQEVMARWVWSKVRLGIGVSAWSTWTFRNLGASLSTTSRTRVGVRAARAAATTLVGSLTAPAGAGAAIAVLEGWTKGDDGGSPRHHVHTLSRGDEPALRAAEARWRLAHGHVLVRYLPEEGDLVDACHGVARYAIKDALKQSGFFVVGGVAWQA